MVILAVVDLAAETTVMVGIAVLVATVTRLVSKLDRVRSQRVSHLQEAPQSPCYGC